MSKPRILILVASYWPGYKSGGPTRSIRNFVQAFREELDVFLVTEDRDAGDTEPYSQVKLDGWNSIDGAQVRYLRKKDITPRRLVSIFNEVNPDLTYLNSFFSPRFTILPLLMRRLGLLPPDTRVLLAPRGEFAREALALKAFKKRLYLWLFRFAGLGARLHWQFSSQQEFSDCRSEMALAAEDASVSFNLTSEDNVLKQVSSAADGSRGPIKFAFLGRIVPMKNLDYLLAQLAHVSGNFELHIYGPEEDRAYAATCRSLATALSPRVSVTWHGHIEHDTVPDILPRHHCFLCPSRGENFGHVIYEALAAGLPVIVSDRTPWLDLEACRVGWVRPLDDAGQFVGAIKEALAMSTAERAAMSERAKAYAQALQTNPKTKQSHWAAIVAAMNK